MLQYTGMTVSELCQVISSSLKRTPELRNVTVTAEVSGFKNYLPSGHWYFALKDSSAVINCVMYRQNNIHAAIMPDNGTLVTVRGYVDYYSSTGKTQLYVDQLQVAGIGTLYEQFAALKDKLQAEGVFAKCCRELPRIPRKVAVITSKSGAVWHDILNVSGNRCPFIPIVLVHSGVQGAGAPAELIQALNKAQRIQDVDVIIIARGGGSMEDLWCFNDEGLARAIAASVIPVVSGVGHETDTTICDYAADVRASTPSNAAEIVFPDVNELIQVVWAYSKDLDHKMESFLRGYLDEVQKMKDRFQCLSPMNHIHNLSEERQKIASRLSNVMNMRLNDYENLIERYGTRLNKSFDFRMINTDAQLKNLKIRLESISPLSVLDRGYAVVSDSDGHVIPDTVRANQVKDIQIRFRDGVVGASRKE